MTKTMKQQELFPYNTQLDSNFYNDQLDSNFYNTQLHALLLSGTWNRGNLKLYTWRM